MTENREKILRLVEATIHPSVMTKQEAFDFLDELIGDLESSRDTIKDELDSEETSG
jgi:polyhydroxyalkanoate synthesis regulator phasin